MQLDSVDRRLLNLIQTGFPLTKEPYTDLGRRLGAGVNEVVQRIEQLKREGIIRLIGPVLDSRSLGYHTTLVAMRVAEIELEKAKKVIAGHPGVSHGYEREHHFNVWFTLAVPPAIDVETEMEQITRSTGAEAAFSLPAIKMFKIGAYFDMSEDGENAPAPRLSYSPDNQVELSITDRLIINELQQDLPLIPMPFNAMAENIGMDVEKFLGECRSLQDRGVIRRFSASINHNRAGFTVNAMSCWAIPSDEIDVAGQKLALLKEVSHCYERKTNQLWRYNLFAMIHSRSREKSQDIVEKISYKTGIVDYALLYSTKEFKKSRVKYLV